MRAVRQPVLLIFAGGPPTEIIRTIVGANTVEVADLGPVSHPLVPCFACQTMSITRIAPDPVHDIAMVLVWSRREQDTIAEHLSEPIYLDLGKDRVSF
jgi:hypothetical protein